MARARMNFLGIHPPVVVGTIVGMNAEPNPLTMLAAKPLDSRVRNGVEVMVSYPPWPSLHGRWFAVQVMDLINAQFRLLGADTTAEPAFEGGGTVSIKEVRTYVPPADGGLPPP